MEPHGSCFEFKLIVEDRMRIKGIVLRAFLTLPSNLYAKLDLYKSMSLPDFIFVIIRFCPLHVGES